MSSLLPKTSKERKFLWILIAIIIVVIVFALLFFIKPHKLHWGNFDLRSEKIELQPPPKN
jgi:hypothetical protein